MNKKNLNNNKNEDNRRTIEINSKNEIKKNILDKLNKQIILSSNDNKSYDNLFDCTNNNFIFFKDLKGDKDKQDISILEDD